MTDGLSTSPQARSLPRAGHALSIGHRPRGIVMRCSCPYLIVWLMLSVANEMLARAGDIRPGFSNVKTKNDPKLQQLGDIVDATCGCCVQRT